MRLLLPLAFRVRQQPRHFAIRRNQGQWCTEWQVAACNQKQSDAFKRNQKQSQESESIRRRHLVVSALLIRSNHTQSDAIRSNHLVVSPLLIAAARHRVMRVAPVVPAA